MLARRVERSKKKTSKFTRFYRRKRGWAVEPRCRVKQYFTRQRKGKYADVGGPWTVFISPATNHVRGARSLMLRGGISFSVERPKLRWIFEPPRSIRHAVSIQNIEPNNRTRRRLVVGGGNAHPPDMPWRRWRPPIGAGRFSARLNLGGTWTTVKLPVHRRRAY